MIRYNGLVFSTASLSNNPIRTKRVNLLLCNLKAMHIVPWYYVTVVLLLLTQSRVGLVPRVRPTVLRSYRYLLPCFTIHQYCCTSFFWVEPYPHHELHHGSVVVSRLGAFMMLSRSSAGRTVATTTGRHHPYHVPSGRCIPSRWCSIPGSSTSVWRNTDGRRAGMILSALICTSLSIQTAWDNQLTRVGSSDGVDRRWDLPRGEGKRVARHYLQTWCWTSIPVKVRASHPAPKWQFEFFHWTTGGVVPWWPWSPVPLFRLEYGLALGMPK
jgi:hypothetical protein